LSGPVPADIVALADYERHARGALPAQAWGYIAGGGADGITARWNREAFDRIALAGRVLADMAGATTALTLLALDLPHPILLAPVAFQKLAHPDGELAMALGAAAAGALAVVSAQASTALEDVAAQAHGPLWFQLYVQQEREATLSLVRRAEAAGYRALVVTVDALVNGVRNVEQRAGFALPAGIEAVNLRGMAPATHRAGPGESPVFKGLLDRAPTWRDIEWLRGETRLPLLLKGIMAPQDADAAVRAGCDAIVVSNHGGRTLDTLPATIDVLPAIVQAVAGRVPVLLDGGVRRGTDIVKALERGAAAVLIGQPVMHALAVAGAVGVAHMLTILRAELEVAMALTGRRSLAECRQAT
jgi:4-hydroxymandelate oxidase